MPWNVKRSAACPADKPWGVVKEGATKPMACHVSEAAAQRQVRALYANEGKMQPMKATLLDDDAFRLRAIPFSGPIPSPIWPGGVDLDGQTFTHRTDIKPSWFTSRPVDWHHGQDPTGKMGRTVIAKAVDLEEEDDGWWVTVWMNAGERRHRLIKALQERGAVLYGSSESHSGLVKVNKSSGHIDVWPYLRQTLSTSPQNTHSIIVPLKASLDAMLAGGHYPSDAFWEEILDSLHDLGPDLVRAKAGRTDGRALAETLDAADAQVTRLLALFERAQHGGHTDGGGNRP